jgi:hypothetical protein
MQLVSKLILGVICLILIVIIPIPVHSQIVQSGNIILDQSDVIREKLNPSGNFTDWELITNGGFETGSFPPWTHNGAWQISTHNPHQGTYCAYDVGNNWLMQEITPTPANQIASATLWCRQPGAQISAIDFIYTNIPYSEDIIWPTSSWEQYNVTSFIEPNGIVSAIRVWGYSGPPPQETFFDDISIQTYGAPDVTIELIPDFSTVNLPPNGGTLEFTATVANLGTGVAVFNVWTEALLFIPDTILYGPLLNRNLTLGPSITISRDLTQSIPSNAPNGAYYYIGKVGDYPATVVDLDTFYFSKGIYNENSAGLPFADWGITGWDRNLTAAVVPPAMFCLNAPAPNPFNQSVSIAYSLSVPGEVSLAVFDITGRLVNELTQGYYPAGEYQACWKSSREASGVYFFNLTVNGQSAIQKAILLK